MALPGAAERQLLRGSPELGREALDEELPIVSSDLEDSIGQGLTTVPAPIRCTPVDTVFVDPGNPERPIWKGTPAVHAAEDPTLEPPSRVTGDLGDIQRSESREGIGPVKCRIHLENRC